ncbi:MAG: alanine racemase [Thermodesulfobacteriota bacterium]
MIQHPIWAEIDLGAIAHNCRRIRGHIQPKTGFMAVVKAGGYGHGAKEVARTVLEHGADQLAVARLQEALELRQAGIEASILILGWTSAWDIDLLLEQDLVQSVFDLEQARELSHAAQARGRKLKCHLKLDTGMGRLGLPAQDAGSSTRAQPKLLQAIQEIFQLPGLWVQGLYTHLAQADNPDLSHCKGQLACLQTVLEQMRRQGLEPGLCHAANSAGVLNLQESHLDLIRPGLILYGLYPELNRANLELKPAMHLKARVIQVRELLPGHTVSYGSTFVARDRVRIATVPTGYADGYPRILSNQGQMLLKGHRATVAGRVCMDLTMLDVSHIPGVEAGDEILILGEQQGQGIRAEELGSLSCSINYEIVSRLGSRVPRLYI